MDRPHIVTVVKELYKCLMSIVMLVNHAIVASMFLGAARLSSLYTYLPHVYNKTYVLIIKQGRQYDKAYIALALTRPPTLRPR